MGTLRVHLAFLPRSIAPPTPVVSPHRIRACTLGACTSCDARASSLLVQKHRCVPLLCGLTFIRACWWGRYECSDSNDITVAGVNGGVRMCSAVDGTWNGTDLVCAPCSLSSSSNLNMQCEDSVCTFSCVPGWCVWHLRLGSSVQLCHLANRSHRVLGVLVAFAFIIVGFARLWCCNRFHSSGDITRTCSLDTGTWSGADTVCEPCATPSTLPAYSMFTEASANGTCAQAGVCTYQCQPGFFSLPPVDGDEHTAVCSTSTGTWSTPAMDCQPCPPLSTPLHASQVCTSSEYSMQCSFACDTGYVLIDGCGAVFAQLATVGCGWKKQYHVCAVSCQCVWAVLTRECARFYKVNGSSTLQCAPINGWSLDAPRLHCDACATPPVPDHGVRTCVNGTCSFTCDAGFFAGAGAFVRHCSAESGEWSGQLLQCDPCTPPATSTHVQRDCVPEGGSCSFSCEPGTFVASGDASRTCSTTDGSWSGTDLACQACVEPGVNTHVTQSCAGDGSSCSGVCSAGFYASAGSAVRTCSTVTGAWSGTALECSACVEPVVPGNATVVASGNGTVVVRCAMGMYARSGDTTRSCSALTGVWSGSAAQCTPCETPTPGPGASVQCQDAGATCSYRCAPGLYHASGASTRVCDAETGLWSGDAFACAACSTPQAALLVEQNCSLVGVCTELCTPGCVSCMPPQPPHRC